MGREITQQLFLLGCGAEMLRHASPPLAQAWCQMMLDTRGEMPLSARVQNDLPLRATGDCGNVWPVVHAIRREPRGIRHRVSPVRASYPTVVLHTFE